MEEIIKCIAVGDSLGLSYEGIKGPIPIKRYQHFLRHKGLTSDDTQHASLTLHSLKAAKDDPTKFKNILGSNLAKWLLCCPPGIGFATLRSGLKLLCGLRSPNSSVYSAGNGPAMRSVIIGAYYHKDSTKLEEFIEISTTTTHADPKATTASLALAKTTAHIYRNKAITLPEILEVCRACGQDKVWLEILSKMESTKSFEEFLQAMNLGRGATGFIYHTVPVAMMLWHYYHEQGMEAIFKAIEIGGDTDSTAAVVGGLMGVYGFKPPVKMLRIYDLGYQLKPSYSWLEQVWWNLVLLLTIFIKHIPARIWYRTSQLVK